MRILHVVKTSDGARWAAWQARVLKRLGIDVHVALPSSVGEAVAEWQNADTHIHIADVSLPVRRLWLWPSVVDTIKRLIKDIAPDLIHSHFVTTTLAFRLALGPKHDTPRIFQVPGPLHLEHLFYRLVEIRTAGDCDYWIASSRYTQRLYAESGVSPERVLLSYYGSNIDRLEMIRSGKLREKLGIPAETKIVGNINYMYPPKYFLGQTTGLKGHEDVIDALGIVCQQQPDVVGVLVGGQWSGGDWYERRLQRRARHVAGNRIIFTGRVEPQTVLQYLSDFDCTVHVPISENCGGVIEPLAAAIPTIASKVGGIPEVVVEGKTGWLVPPRQPVILAQAILEVLSQSDEAHRRAVLGSQLVRTMFDINRTAREIAEIYRHVIDSSTPRPEPFDSESVLRSIERGTVRDT
jgi:glycosyltransferase involved in cell wall biosynthesis